MECSVPESTAKTCLLVLNRRGEAARQAIRSLLRNCFPLPLPSTFGGKGRGVVTLSPRLTCSAEMSKISCRAFSMPSLVPVILIWLLGSSGRGMLILVAVFSSSSCSFSPFLPITKRWCSLGIVTVAEACGKGRGQRLYWVFQMLFKQGLLDTETQGAALLICYIYIPPFIERPQGSSQNNSRLQESECRWGGRALHAPGSEAERLFPSELS